MPANEPIQNLPAPINSDPPDGPTQIAAVNAATVDRLNMRFASVAARDAAIPNPVDGMEAFTGSGANAVKWVYVNGTWNALMTKAVAGRRDSGDGQPIPANTLTEVNFGSLKWALGGVTTSGNGLKVPVDGLYAIDATVRTLDTSSNRLQVRLQINGSTVATNQTTMNLRYISIATTYPLQAGDVVTALVYQYTVASATAAFSGDPHLTVALVAAT